MTNHKISIINHTNTDSLKSQLSIIGHHILFFSASWCGPCRKLKSYIQDYANKHMTKLNPIYIHMIDIDFFPDLNNTFYYDTADSGIEFKLLKDIKQIPTIIFLDKDKLEKPNTRSETANIKDFDARFSLLDTFV